MRAPAAFITAGLSAVAALAAAPAGGLAQSSPTPPPPRAARLVGTFALSGRVTLAAGIRGERKGDTVQRTWTFTPLCPAGACSSIALVRERAGGSDRLLLHRRRPGLYVGRGTFAVRLRCAGRIYPEGELVPFKVSVRIQSTGIVLDTPIATGIRATYTNRSRTNLTPCVSPGGHDAARYTGQILPAAV